MELVSAGSIRLISIGMGAAIKGSARAGVGGLGGSSMLS